MQNQNQTADTATTQETAATVANQSIQESGKKGKKGKKGNDGDTKKRKAISPMWRVLTKARKMFNPQITKSVAIKRQCIVTHFGDLYPDVDIFWADYQKECEKLLDRLSYRNDCKKMGISPENLAEHIVFLGSATLNSVLKDGVEKLGLVPMLYQHRLSPKIVINEKITDAFRNEKEEEVKAEVNAEE
jgi:hypothetical protein